MTVRTTAVAALTMLTAVALSSCSSEEDDKRTEEAVAVLSEATVLAEKFAGGVEIRDGSLDITEDINNHVEAPESFTFTSYDYDPQSGELNVCLTTPGGWYGYTGANGKRGPVKHGSGETCSRGKEVAGPIKDATKPMPTASSEPAAS